MIEDDFSDQKCKDFAIICPGNSISVNAFASMMGGLIILRANNIGR